MTLNSGIGNRKMKRVLVLGLYTEWMIWLDEMKVAHPTCVYTIKYVSKFNSRYQHDRSGLSWKTKDRIGMLSKWVKV